MEILVVVFFLGYNADNLKPVFLDGWYPILSENCQQGAENIRRSGTLPDLPNIVFCYDPLTGEIPPLTPQQES